MLPKAVLELWGEGGSWEELVAAVAAYPAEKKAPYAGEDQVRCCVGGW